MPKDARRENAKLGLLDLKFALDRLGTALRETGYSVADFAETYRLSKKRWRENIMKRRAVRRRLQRRLP